MNRQKNNLDGFQFGIKKKIMRKDFKRVLKRGAKGLEPKRGQAARRSSSALFPRDTGKGLKREMGVRCCKLGGRGKPQEGAREPPFGRAKKGT